MRAIQLFVLFCAMLLIPINCQAADSLQAQIDAAPENGTIQLHKGIYNEAITISRPVTIEGTDGTVIRSCSKDPVVSIKGQNATLKNITIVQCSKEKGVSALYVTGTGHTLDQLDIQTEQFGIKMDHALETKVQNISLVGTNKGNGIDLWESSGNMITDVSIHKARDGIYLENSHANTLLRNSISDSRYGIHLMFSNGTKLLRNHSYHNITGAMVMGTKQTTIEHNILSFNQKNVNAQGLLLYDATDTTVLNNDISYNRVGAYIENAEANVMKQNEVRGNFIGIQLKKARTNTVAINTFIGNAYDAQAIDSSHNTIERNYWDTSWKLDTNGTGISKLPYRADPFFLTLTSEVPEYQLFFQAPGMIVLQKLLKSPDELLLVDQTPSVSATVHKQAIKSPANELWVTSIGMILTSIILFFIGRKRI
ncbi:nitrous oxide reductase family maturation protein NosD [Microbacteriaceae bacterium 4G12]